MEGSKVIDEFLKFLRDAKIDYTVNQDIEREAERVMLLRAVERLAPREKKIMVLRFGLGSGREHTQKEVADCLGISQSYISRLEKRIIHRLRRDLEKAGAA